MPPTGGLWYWARSVTKQNTQPNMRDNHCPHLNPSHRETLLSLHLKNELLRMAHQVTGTSHPFLQRIGKGQAVSWQAMPCTTDTHSWSNKKRSVSIGVMKKESLLQWASLTFIIPKKKYASTEYSWFKGTQWTDCRKTLSNSQHQFHTGEAKA